jgi:hypothetical protein
MNIRLGHFILPFLAIAVGTALIYLGWQESLGAAWVAGGVLFIAIGVGALVLNLAWILPDPWGAWLKGRAVGMLILGIVLFLLAATVVLGIASSP